MATTSAESLIDPPDALDPMPEAAHRRALRVLLASTFLTWGGFFVVVPLIAVHYVDRLGWTAASIGLVLALRQFTQQGLTTVGGVLADRLGAKGPICAGMLLRALGFATMAAADGYGLLIFSAILAAVGGALFEAPKAAAIAALTTEADRPRYYAQTGVAAGLGTTLGTQLGALLLRADFALVCLAGAVTFFAIFWVVLLALPPVRVAQARQGSLRGLGLALRDRPFVTFNALMAGYWFMWTQYAISLPLAAAAIAGTADAVAWVYAVNAGTTLILGYPLPRLAGRRLEPPALLVLGVLLTALGLGAVAASPNTPALLAAVLLFSVGAVLVRPGEQTVAAGLADPAALGSYFGVAALSLAVGGGLGNDAGGALYDLGQRLDRPALPWFLFAAVGLLTAAGLQATLNRRPTPPIASPPTPEPPLLQSPPPSPRPPAEERPAEMPPPSVTADPTVAAALDAFRPDRFGFRPHRAGWLRETGGAVAVAPLAWPHAHAASQAGDEPEPRSALALLVDLQRQTWGMPPEEVLPANLLAVLADTGGSVLVAYDPAPGFTAAGWLGFAIALGARDGTLVSHMLGVREEDRGARDLGWTLKLIQAHEALRTGHTAAAWTFDPMRGANARLNLEKLGAGVDAFTVDKYGPLRSDLYGPVPSDRLTARWDLVAPTTAARLKAVWKGSYRGMGLDALAGIPDVTPECLTETATTRPPRLRYRIPDDVDRLMRDDPAAAIRWRREMRTVFSALLPTRSASIGPDPAADPLALAVLEAQGAYAITGFATGIDATGERASYYLLERTEGTR